MGGNTFKAVVAPIKKAVTKSVTAAGNIGEGILAGDIKKTVKNTGAFLEEGAKFGTGITTVKGTMGGLSQAIADVSGATALKEQLDQQMALSRDEARRQALLSDELSRSAGGEGARVSLNTRRNRLGMNQSATGITGAASSRGTGVQQ